jgi:hypothetical protein
MDSDPDALHKVKKELLSGLVSWEDFVWIGSSHFVLPALYSAFKRNHLLSLLRGELVEHLSNIYDLNLVRNQKILEQSQELIRIFNSKGLEPIFLKGAGHLLQGLYFNPGDRIMSDIDILFPVGEIPIASKILYDNGYSHPEEFDDDDFEKHHHLPGFENENYVAMVELHHSVFPGKYQKLLQTSAVVRDKMKIEGYNAWVLSIKHQLALSFIHDQLVDDGLKYRSMLIKSLYDFYLLAMLKETGKGMPIINNYNRALNNYCAIVSGTFNNAKVIQYSNSNASKRFRKQFDFLLDHPKFFTLYHFIVLYKIRIAVIFGSLFTAPFSKQSRLYIKKKAGTLSALKRFVKNLKQEV